MTETIYTCDGCLWADSCDATKRCDDYTSEDLDRDIQYYHNALKENGQVYQSIVDEMRG